MKLQIIEDETKTASYLKKGLSEAGYVVDVANRGDQGLDIAWTGEYDLIVLDVMLPGQDGWQVLQRLRDAGRQTPVLLLTARDSIQDRVKGLGSGADDYVIKPFAFSELLARVTMPSSCGQVRPIHLGVLNVYCIAWWTSCTFLCGSSQPSVSVSHCSITPTLLPS